jgi:hypothetical protein
MAQNPKNALPGYSTPGSANPSTIKGKPAVAGGTPKVVGKASISQLFPQATAGAKKASSAATVPAPKGVVLGTTKGNHHVAHAAGAATPHLTNSIQQGK